MLKLPLLLASLVVAFVWIATPAAAAKLYRWVDAEGTVSFTDDYEKIPLARRETAKVVNTEGLNGYARFTPEDSGRRRAENEALHARVERLRGLNALPPVAAAPPVDPGMGQMVAQGSPNNYTATVDVNGATIRLPTNTREDGPVIVEQIRSVRKGKNITQMATVVRQGDEVLMVVYPNPHSQISAGDFVDEEDLYDGMD